ncbi:hypothetical protein GW17_00047699 [Ensete ventricosum]|nr:hypothetical protein GW17_00047699 [Ensete ventricosum]
MIRAAGELDCSIAHIRLREPSKSEDKIEDGTSMESSIPCSHGGKEFVVKGAEEECLTKKRSRQYVVLYILYSEESTTKLMEKIVLSQR